MKYNPFILFVMSMLWFLPILAQPFSEIVSQTGLDLAVNNNGVAIADYDLDGDLDVFFTGFYSFDPDDESTWNRLFTNNNDGTFTDITMAAGFTNQFVNLDVIASSGEKLGASWGDFDNDGDPDIFLSNSRLDQLYLNNGDGTFTDITDEAGVAGCHTCYSAGGLWFDHDRDGSLDLYVSNLKGPNRLYRNNTDGTFTDITDRENVAGEGVTWTTVALDVGKDGYIDLYCANDTQNNELWENRSGLRYNETSRAARVADEGAGMGIAVGDYNNDGLFDIYVTNIYNHKPNPLLENLGNRRYMDFAQPLGVNNTGWGWGTHFFDYDLDGDEDLAAVNGVISQQFVNDIEQMDVKNFFFRNLLKENGRVVPFEDISSSSGTEKDARARGMEVFDYDGDGDLDMIVANVEST
ncbi:MAG: VCBS repeat-containing protein, partial [Saprospiraceae bacterium]|nr:VCBS repeat-containing protein [Saprospiraceae bacterium]